MYIIYAFFREAARVSRQVQDMEAAPIVEEGAQEALLEEMDLDHSIDEDRWQRLAADPEPEDPDHVNNQPQFPSIRDKIRAWKAIHTG